MEAIRWLEVLFPSLAMMLGWGIRGQFGHETGAMVPGAFVGFAIAIVSGSDAETALRLAAVGALACSVGGSMTYGQTVGLVHDLPKSPTYWWGLLGCAIKGSVWVGITGAFLGMASGSVEYRPMEIAVLLGAMVSLSLLGVRLINQPFDPPSALPRIYFSKRLDPKPRFENWGGIWFALVGLVVYLQFIRHDLFSVKMAFGGMLGGAVGFVVGEMIQAWGRHKKPFGEKLNPWIDWWKAMEMTFGAVAGLSLGLGWLLMRNADVLPIVSVSRADEVGFISKFLESAAIGFWLIWGVLSLSGWKYSLRIQRLWKTPFLSLVIPMACVFGGRLSSFLIVLPFLTFVSALNVVKYLSTEQGILHMAVGIIGILLLTAGTELAVSQWNIADEPSLPYFRLTLWMQTLLTLPKGNLKTWKERGAKAWFLSSRSFLLVEILFIVLALLMT